MLKKVRTLGKLLYTACSQVTYLVVVLRRILSGFVPFCGLLLLGTLCRQLRLSLSSSEGLLPLIPGSVSNSPPGYPQNRHHRRHAEPNLLAYFPQNRHHQRLAEPPSCLLIFLGYQVCFSKTSTTDVLLRILSLHLWEIYSLLVWLPLSLHYRFCFWSQLISNVLKPCIVLLLLLLGFFLS